MDTATVLLMVLLGAATALCAVVAWGVFEVVKTARSVRVLVDDVDARIIPFIEKADVTLDVANLELLRIDEIVSQVEEITESINSTSRTVQEVAKAPAEIVSGIAQRVRKAWRTRRNSTVRTQTVEPGHPGDNAPPYV